MNRFTGLKKSACGLFAFLMTIGMPSHARALLGGSNDDWLKSDPSQTEANKMEPFQVQEAGNKKPYTLFMGADIALNLDKDLYAVKNVVGSDWIVSINGVERYVSARTAPSTLKITPNLKLTEVGATVIGFRKVPAYSYDNDPNVRLTRGLSSSASVNADLQAVASDMQARADTAASYSLGAMAWFSWGDDQFSANAMETTAKYLFAELHGEDNGTTTTFSAGGPPGFGTTLSGSGPPSGQAQLFRNPTALLNAAIVQGYANKAELQTNNGSEAGSRLAVQGLDALDITFDIRAPNPIREPYVVTITKFRKPDSRPGAVQDLIYAQSIHPIDEHLSHVHFVESGFPFSYEIVDFQLHIYDGGREIATNVAKDRVELSRDEAFEYVKMEYLAAHPRDTLPAVPALGSLPKDLKQRLAEGMYRKPFYIRVSPEGLAASVFLDPACTKRVNDEYLSDVVRRIRFKPALNAGKPTTGTVQLNLNNLKI